MKGQVCNKYNLLLKIEMEKVLEKNQLKFLNLKEKLRLLVLTKNKN